MSTSKTIIINTSAQYVRTILNMVLALFATRIVLKALGVSDYGIFSLISGVISILSFITSALVISTQRFLSVSQGKSSLDQLKKIFNTSVILHLIVGIVLVLVLELLLPLFFSYLLNIPIERVGAAKLLYHSTVIILFLTFITSPFRAVIVSHENIVFISVIEVVDGFLKLFVAFGVLYVEYDVLVVYGYLLISIQLFNFIALFLYSHKKYLECRVLSLAFFDKKYLYELFSFTGWIMYNIGCNYGRVQGIAFTLNHFFGSVINAAYGIGFQVSGALNSISQSLMNALNPQLMKAEGAGNRARMLRLAELECKFTFLLLAAVAIPAIFEMPNLLKLWLGTVPDNAPLFCRMVVLSTLVDMLTSGLGSANQAVGNIRNFTLVVYTIKLLTLPVVILVLFLNCPLVYVAGSYVFFEFLSAMYRIYFLKKTSGLDVGRFVTNVFGKEVIPIIVIVSASLLSVLYIESNFRFVVTFLMSDLLFFIAIYYFGLSSDEKNLVINYISKIREKVSFVKR